MIFKHNIEKPTKSDYEELIEIWEAAVRATHHFLPESEIAFFRPLILAQYFDAVNLFCVRNDAGKILGFLGTSDYKIEMLFIHPDYFGKGIGKLLTLYAINELKIRKVDVNEQNPQAVSFYQKMNFVVVKRNPTDGLGKPFPILAMELKLE
jgi:putative acetyltransferase